MLTLAAFGDEIADDLDAQLRVLVAEGVRHLELRKAWGRNVLDLDDGGVEMVRRRLAVHGVRVSAIGSPIGKVDVTADFAAHLERFERCLHVTRALQASFVRMFSFRMPPGEDPAAHRPEVMRRLAVLAARAEAAGVTLLLENEKRTYGDTATRMADVFATVRSGALRCTFDPANFVQVGVRPFAEAYPLLRPHIAYLHMKDALFATRTVVPVGEGEGDVPRLLEAVSHAGYAGFLSLEPHLGKSPRYAGLDAPARFSAAVSACRGVLSRLGLEWE